MKFYPYIILGLTLGLVILYLLLSISDKLDKVISFNDRPVSCNSLPYGVQEKIEQTYENIVSFKCEINE